MNQTCSKVDMSSMLEGIAATADLKYLADIITLYLLLPIDHLRTWEVAENG